MSGSTRRSRGRKRRQRSATIPITTLANPTPRLPGESQRSASYRAGKAVRYTYRIQGPQFPVTITQRNNNDT